MGPIRDIPIARLSSVKVDELRPLSEQVSIFMKSQSK
jgi:hypothetical protein